MQNIMQCTTNTPTCGTRLNILNSELASQCKRLRVSGRITGKSQFLMDLPMKILLWMVWRHPGPPRLDGMSSLEILGSKYHGPNNSAMQRSAPPLKLQGRASSEPAACGHEVNRHQSPFTTCYFQDAFSRLLQFGINKQYCYYYVKLDLFMYI